MVQLSNEAENILKIYRKTELLWNGWRQDEVINMACNMGGMGFIENNKALCIVCIS